MKLSIGFETTDQAYTLLITIYHKATCILRTDYKCFYNNTTKRQSIDQLQMNINNICMNNGSFEIFSNDNIHNGSSVAMSFANDAFLYAHTLMPGSDQEVTTNNIYFLRPDEMVQFYCELHKLSSTIQNAP